MNEPRPLLRCDRLRVEIGELVVARELTFRMYPGQCWCLLGRNGVGKTTLLHTLAGLRPAGSGSIQLSDTALDRLTRKQVAQRLAMLFQDQTDSFPASVREKVLQGRHPYLRAWQWESADDHELVSRLLHKLELEALDSRNIQTLSGGERQRVAVATALAQHCRLLLLDEPTNHLDLRHRFGLLSMLADDCREQRHTLMMSLHDINLAARFCSHALLLMGNGEVLHGAVDELLDSQVLENLYQQPLVEVETPSGRAWLPR